MTETQAGLTNEQGEARSILKALEIVLTVGIILGAIVIASVLVDRPGLDLAGSTDPYVDAELAFPVDFEGRFATFEDDTGAIRDRATGQRPMDLGTPVVARFTFLEPKSDTRIIWTLWHLIGPVLVMAGLAIARSITRSASSGDPFTRINVRRLWALGTIVALGGMTHSLISGAAATLMLQRSAAADLTQVQFSFSFLPLLVGLGIAALAAVWQHGVALREELDATI